MSSVLAGEAESRLPVSMLLSEATFALQVFFVCFFRKINAIFQNHPFQSFCSQCQIQFKPAKNVVSSTSEQENLLTNEIIYLKKNLIWVFEQSLLSSSRLSNVEWITVKTEFPIYDFHRLPYKLPPPSLLFLFLFLRTPWNSVASSRCLSDLSASPPLRRSLMQSGPVVLVRRQQKQVLP